MLNGGQVTTQEKKKKHWNHDLWLILCMHIHVHIL